MRILLALLICISFVGICSADLYVLYDSATLEIKSAIKKDDAVLEPGWTKVILPGKLKDYGLTKHPRYYKFIDGEFIQNNEMINKEVNDLEEAQNYSDEITLIQKRSLRLACEDLEQKDGVIFQYLTCGDFE